jgi:protocatechuate 3,4-dioxygenase beta subunit
MPRHARRHIFAGISGADSNGWVHFNTLYPGWYSGRTTHIHATVRVNGTDIVTTQFFFPDTVNDLVYRSHASYLARPTKDTTNARDGIANSGSGLANFLLPAKLLGLNQSFALKVIAVRSSKTTC